MTIREDFTANFRSHLQGYPEVCNCGTDISDHDSGNQKGSHVLDPFGIQKNKSNGNQGTYKGSDDQSIRGYILGDFKIVDHSKCNYHFGTGGGSQNKSPAMGFSKRSEEENQIKIMHLQGWLPSGSWEDGSSR